MSRKSYERACQFDLGRMFTGQIREIWNLQWAQHVVGIFLILPYDVSLLKVLEIIQRNRLLFEILLIFYNQGSFVWIYLFIHHYFITETENLDLTSNNEHDWIPLTHFSPVSHFYIPWKRQKTKGFLMFSGGIEMWHWTKMG